MHMSLVQASSVRLKQANLYFGLWRIAELLGHSHVYLLFSKSTQMWQSLFCVCTGTPDDQTYKQDSGRDT